MTDIIVNLPHLDDSQSLDWGDANLAGSVSWAIHRPAQPTDLDTVLAEVRKLAENAAPPLVLEVDATVSDALANAQAEVAASGVKNIVLLERGGPVRVPGTTDLANVPTRADTGALDRAVAEAVGKMMGGLGIDQAALRGELTDLYDLVADTLATWTSGLSELPDTLQKSEDSDYEDRAEPPVTPYDARLFFADGTSMDLPNIAGVQVHESGTHRFPFGFMEVDEVDPVTGTATKVHRPVYWSAEDGQMMPFSAAEAPTPNDGW